MNKYELAVVLSAAIEDEARLAALEKVKEYLNKHNNILHKKKLFLKLCHNNNQFKI